MGADNFAAEVDDFEKMQRATTDFCMNLAAADDQVNNSKEKNRDQFHGYSNLNDTSKLHQDPFKNLPNYNNAVRKQDADTIDVSTEPVLVFPQTKWNPDIVITASDCSLIFSKSGCRDEIRQRYDANPTPVFQPLPPGNERPVGC